MADLEPFPELLEGRRLDPDRINGVDQARLTIGAEGDAVVTFRDEVAALQNVLGVYLIDPDGTIRDPEIVFARIEHSDPLPGLPPVRPGGGPLEPGDDVALSDLYPNTDLQPGQQFGLFIVADGAERNPSFVFDGSGRLEFVNTATGGPANVADDAGEIELRHIADDGTEHTVEGRVFHTADVDPDRLENNLNPNGAERVVSGVDATSGALVLGFEDLVDFDFNDVVLDLGPPVVAPPPIVTPPASLADLDGTNGFRLDGINAFDASGISVAGAGDVNGDGTGESYVVFGRASGFDASLNLAALDGTRGFRHVTAVSRSDVADGWRDRRTGGGVLVDVAANEVVLEGLSMPHSPRWHDAGDGERLWLLDSGTGWFGHTDLERRQFERVAFCPGYSRGLACHGRFAVIGLSKPRENGTFTGLPLDQELIRRDAEARCGLMIVDLHTGDAVHWLRIEGVVEELYDVAVLPDVRRPMAIGLKTDAIRRMITVAAPQEL